MQKQLPAAKSAAINQRCCALPKRWYVRYKIVVKVAIIGGSKIKGAAQNHSRVPISLMHPTIETYQNPTSTKTRIAKLRTLTCD